MSVTGLLVVDLQRVFADPASPWHVPGLPAALDRTLLLLEAYAGRAVATRFVPDADPAGSWADYYDAWPFARDPARADQWELVPSMAASGVPVVDAPTMGKWGPAVSATLGHPDTVVLCGVATECCVLATALAASDAGIRVRLVADACAGGSTADHDAALRVLGAFAPQVEVVTLAEALALA